MSYWFSKPLRHRKRLPFKSWAEETSMVVELTQVKDEENQFKNWKIARLEKEKRVYRSCRMYPHFRAQAEGRTNQKERRI